MTNRTAHEILEQMLARKAKMAELQAANERDERELAGHYRAAQPAAANAPYVASEGLTIEEQTLEFMRRDPQRVYRVAEIIEQLAVKNSGSVRTAMTRLCEQGQLVNVAWGKYQLKEAAAAAGKK